MPFIIVSPSGMLPMGVDKVNDLVVSPGASNLKIPDWTARSGYSGTVPTNHELVAAGSGAGTVRCRAQLAAAWAPQSGALRLSLMQNDTELKAADFAQNATSLALSDTPVTVQPGDRIWLRISNSTGSIWAISATVQAGSNTYLTFDPS